MSEPQGLVTYHNATTPFTHTPMPHLNDLRGYTDESMDSIEYLDKLRILQSDSISLRGFAVMAFCKSIIEPSSERFAASLRVLSLNLGNSPASTELMRLVSQTFRISTNLKELIFLGFPEKEVDQHGVFDSVAFSLKRFKTDLPPSTNTISRFLTSQQELTELQTLYVPVEHVRSHQGFASFPSGTIPYLQSLECAGPLLVSILLAIPAAPPVKNLRVNLNKLSRAEESASLAAISKFKPTLKSLSLERKTTKHSRLSTADILSRAARKQEWWRLKYLDLQDNSHDPVSLMSTDLV